MRKLGLKPTSPVADNPTLVKTVYTWFSSSANGNQKRVKRFWSMIFPGGSAWEEHRKRVKCACRATKLQASSAIQLLAQIGTGSHYDAVWPTSILFVTALRIQNASKNPARTQFDRIRNPKLETLTLLKVVAAANTS